MNYVGFDGEVHRGVLVVNADVTASVVRIFSKLFEERFPIRRMQPMEVYNGDLDASLADDNTSAFNCRRPDQINAPFRESPHANGRAIDINPLENPWINLRTRKWSPSAKYAKRTEGKGKILKWAWSGGRSRRRAGSGRTSCLCVPHLRRVVGRGGCRYGLDGESRPAVRAGARMRSSGTPRTSGRRRQVSTVLVEDAQGRLPQRASIDYRVRHGAPDGTTHTDEARVPPKAPAGSTVTVWVDKSGEITAEPLTDGEPRLHAISGGVMAAAGAGGVVLGAAWAVRLGPGRRRMAQWAAEWDRFDTRKGWKTG
ncbi:Rv1733c family protein [Streptomyces sp. DT190]|uniref:Rv1733c family protein n=1 Tax=unclassified Streptomyces TaxID=2593676 RepID=UPI003CED09C0